MPRNTLVKHLLTVLMMVALLATFFGVGSSAAHAQSLSGPSHSVVPASVAPCQPGTGSLTFCIAPQLKIACGGPIGGGNDLNGVPINWTFNTQQPGRVCVTVTYITSVRSPCGFSFYVPKDHATGDIVFQASTSSGTVIFTLNENSTDGWKTIFGNTQNISRIIFTDVNSQKTNSVELGWGRTSSFSLKEVCQG